MTDLPAPHQRESIVGRGGDEARLRAVLAEQALTNGWLIAGPKGAGKATLAYRLARAILEPDSLADAPSLQMPTSARAFRLIAGGAHPDLFVAQRRFDEKKAGYETEIAVETIRALNAFLNKTPALGDWRVAIVDSADDLNRNASNALLKSLEEPPPRTVLLLVANAPGRLLATIRSRCRRIDLRSLPPADIEGLLTSELGVAGAEASPLVAAAQGRPGRALTLAAGEGADAVSAVGAFLHAATTGGDTSRIAQSLTGRQAAGRWEIFCEILLESLSDAARASASHAGAPSAFAGVSGGPMIEALERVSALLVRGDAVNLDRAQLLAAAARILHPLTSARAA